MPCQEFLVLHCCLCLYSVVCSIHTFKLVSYCNPAFSVPRIVRLVQSSRCDGCVVVLFSVFILVLLLKLLDRCHMLCPCFVAVPICVFSAVLRSHVQLPSRSSPVSGWFVSVRLSIPYMHENISFVVWSSMSLAFLGRADFQIEFVDDLPSHTCESLLPQACNSFWQYNCFGSSSSPATCTVMYSFFIGVRYYILSAGCVYLYADKITGKKYGKGSGVLLNYVQVKQKAQCRSRVKYLITLVCLLTVLVCLFLS